MRKIFIGIAILMLVSATVVSASNNNVKNTNTPIGSKDSLAAPLPGLHFEIVSGFGAKVIITNNGTTDIDNVTYWIHVDGGILGLINKTVNDTIDVHAAGEVPITLKIIGFGPITITAKVADQEQTATALLLVFFSYVK